ncbi:DNA-binding protein [Pandoraea terrae]|uniref:DNA-binding protein n=1 Tax=Pandoraea terrae TaxID=1537710 RepID=A0A5E4XDH4_9BURK|nr:PLP-dependent aminotransferase family protein [Pandoraea terrae]VVE34336.1 DNA-binding protein [Pandoraea terrae]
MTVLRSRAAASPSPGGPDDVSALLFSPLAAQTGRGNSLQKQLLGRMKRAILDGRLPAGARLPSSRTLADELSVSRNTVSIVYEQLAAEGFVVAHRQGTRVAALSIKPHRAGSAHGAQANGVRAPDQPNGDRAADRARGPIEAAKAGESPARSLDDAPRDGAANDMAGRVSRRVARLPASYRAARADETPPAFTPGVPALTQFPAGAWRRTLDRVMRSAPARVYGYGDPAGEPALREAIAEHLRISRGVRCDGAQVVVTEGAQEALMLCVRLLVDPGDTVWLEDPGYRGAKTAFHAGDLRLVPLRVDDEGVTVPPGLWDTAPPRLVYTTPSHQYPLGAVLSAARRLDMIAHARRCGAWLIEDDYDSEFRHQGEPIAAMQGLVPDAPVLYVGTFSKTMFPALRIGFLVLPPALAERAGGAMGELLRGGHRFEQLALAEFIRNGQFARHLGRMRRLYRERQIALREALARHLDPAYAVIGERCGLHLTVRLAPSYCDIDIVAAAQREGMNPRALSSFALAPRPEDNGLVIGYGDTDAVRIEPLVRRLAELVADAGRAAPA